MKGLLLKEWYNFAEQQRIFVCDWLFVVTFHDVTTGWGLMMACGVTVALLYTAFPYDEYKWTQTILTSPLGWLRLIAGKYLFCLLCGVVMAVFWFFCHSVLFWSIELVGVLMHTLMFFNYFMILCSVYIPCAYCLKSGMAHLILLLTYLLLLACGGLSGWYMQPDAGASLGWFSLLTVLVLLFSATVTYKIFRQRCGIAEWRNTK